MHKAPENHGDLVEALELKPAAIEVAKDCASSPIIVVTVANALKDKSVQVWKDALQQLRSFATPTNNINGMDPKVYSSLKLSCSTLESEEAKSLFFLCSLLPIDYRISIQDLLKYAKGLPREIGQLTLLRLLDLRNCSKLKAIPYNVLASLSQLEDLNMGNSFVKWEVNGNASLAELKRLSLLVTLDIGITDAKILPKDLGFEKLKRYKIFVGDAWDWSGEY
ncbi:hypothetical protein L1049_027098 [Liquidambar formosana]|uniref:NB-ARC domain-containing protein n=1 Tax=Liquidambar formosana TaxID=63359 RepID=A0AAP0N786_LIQFO